MKLSSTTNANVWKYLNSLFKNEHPFVLLRPVFQRFLQPSEPTKWQTNMFLIDILVLQDLTPRVHLLIFLEIP